MTVRRRLTRNHISSKQQSKFNYIIFRFMKQRIIIFTLVYTILCIQFTLHEYIIYFPELSSFYNFLKAVLLHIFAISHIYTNEHARARVYKSCTTYLLTIQTRVHIIYIMLYTVVCYNINNILCYIFFYVRSYTIIFEHATQ